ncbi:zinc ABC transporter substrate-binding protein [Collinsella sp. AGMB00827]|uniref:Zinc ABC transporter substrate-binding protein n=1 Tax=Collinsella ureilytica TaxID=2869515 RepID=A0ABS7MM57_9ACTN|nr:zinc ABC transporter substrate-binding protein [Collinsella urealyticum]MBY4798143.1 zinc ABC transporter substrate-binding protein [Collinsella urealyticum]
MRKHLRLLTVVFSAFIIALALSGCTSPTSREGGSQKKVIYTTFFPVHDLTSRIVGDKMDVKTIITGDQEPHDFELKTQDMAKITEADLVIYNGSGMESFIDSLKESAQDDSKFLDLSAGLTLLEGGAHSHHDHDHDADDHDADDHDHDADHADKNHDHDAHDHDHGSVNPHTWLSIKNAVIELDTIYHKVAEIDPANADYYKKNLETAEREFKALDEKFEAKLSQVPAEKRMFVVSHAAFNYLAHDYGLKQVAVTGISPEDEPTAAQLATISDFIKTHGINTIFFEGKATPKVAETLAASAGAKTSTLYTMESLTEDEANLGYLTLMERNLDALMGSFDGI